MANSQMLLNQLHHHTDQDVTVSVVESLKDNTLRLVSRSRNGYIISWQVEEPNGRIFHFKERNDAERYIRNHYNIAPQRPPKTTAVGHLRIMWIKFTVCALRCF